MRSRLSIVAGPSAFAPAPPSFGRTRAAVDFTAPSSSTKRPPAFVGSKTGSVVTSVAPSSVIASRVAPSGDFADAGAAAWSLMWSDRMRPNAAVASSAPASAAFGALPSVESAAVLERAVGVGSTGVDDAAGALFESAMFIGIFPGWCEPASEADVALGQLA